MNNPRIKIKYTYDERNRLSSVRYEKGVLMNYHYDPVGNLVECKLSSESDEQVADSSRYSLPKPVNINDRKFFCPSCSTPITPGSRFCSNCGTPIQTEQPKPSTCPSCNKPLKAEARFCTRCGYKVKMP